MKLTDEDLQALCDADAHLSLARSAIGHTKEFRLASEIDRLRKGITKKLRGYK